MVKCYVCRYVEVEKKLGEWRSACDRCAELLKSPPCKACGQPVRDAKKNETNPYHEECRRCSSCNQKVSKLGMHCTAGKILCGSCDDLFGEFFVPGKRMGAEYMKEAFKAWDEDNSGWIDTGELRRVLKAIMPNFSDRDINDLLRVIDTNSNGVVEYEEFCQWLLKENPLDFSETTFAAYVAQLMREAGTAKDKADLCVDEIQVRQDGVYFRLKSGQMRFETTAFRTEALSLTALDPEEFISKVECVEGGLKLSFNTGRITTLEGQGELFGPFEAPMGFYIDGLRVKPLDDPVDGVKDCVTGIDVAPLPSAAEYDCSNALLYTAEQEYLRSLREILAKAAVDVNTFGAGGVTALMLASSRGCTGAMRLLLSCKANPNLADSDGWTALTYASRCGSPEAVQALLEKGATEDKTDGGRALKEALRVKHNAAARALLRAGFGPAPAGTFALEGAVKPEDCKLDAPKILPAGGAFSHPKKVSILVGNVDASKQNGAKVLFTLDGRDPFLCGERYMGPFTVTSRMQLRAVAISGTKRSQSVEATFLVCHCALPDEVIFGTLQAQIFPACLELLLKDTAETLTVTPDQFQVKTAETDFTARWIQLDLHDVRPRHQLHFDLAYASVKSADQRKKWTDAITADIQKAVGEEPKDCRVFAGSIILEFQMTREKADELQGHLEDPESWLLTKAKHRKAFKNASMQVVEALGQRVTSVAFREEVEERIKGKSGRLRVVTIGKEDRGYIATLVADKKEAKWMRKHLESVVKKILEDVEISQVQDHSEYLDLDFSVDIMKAGKGREILDLLALPETTTKIADTMAIMRGIDTKVRVTTPAASRKLAELEVALTWSAKNGKPETTPDVDCSCIIYAEEHLVYACKFSSPFQGNVSSPVEMKDNFHHEEMAKAVRMALTSSSTSAERFRRPISIDVSALPREVTDVYFVMSAEEDEDLSHFASATLSLVDLARDQELTSLECSLDRKACSVVVASLSCHDNGWVVQELGDPCGGKLEPVLEPVLNTLADRQSRHLNWERRRDLIYLRVLHKCSRMARGSDAEFAVLMHKIMELPVAVFNLS